MPKRKIDEVDDNYSRSSNYRFLAACAASSSEECMSDSENESSSSSHTDSFSTDDKLSSDRNSNPDSSCVNSPISDRGGGYYYIHLILSL